MTMFGAVNPEPAALESRLALLTRHFFRRFLDNDLISPNGDGHVGLSQTIAALVSPTLLVTCMVLFKYAMAWRPTWAQILRGSASDGLLFVSLSMIVLGVAATVTWDAFFLDARDRYILSVLPVSDRLLSAAKLAALGLFLAVFVVTVNLVPVLLVPSLMVQGLREESALSHFIALTLAQSIAPSVAGAWMVMAVVSLRGLLAFVLPGRLLQRVSPIVQGVLVLGFLAWAISLSAFIDGSLELLPANGPATRYAPPLWFFGLYQWFAGSGDPWCPPLARTAATATFAAAILVVAVFFAPARRLSEDGSLPAGRSAWRALASSVREAAGRVAVRHPLGRASFNFTLTTLGRSGKHRLYLAGAFGAGLAWAATGLAIDFARSGRVALGTWMPSTPALQVQQALVLFLIAAVRFAILVPASLPANWLFRLSERQPLGRYFAGARRAALAVGLGPVAVLLPVSAALWGWQAAGYHALVGLAFAVFLVELFFNGLAKIPFTAAYVSGQLRLKSRGGFYLFGVMALTAVPSALESLTFRGAVAPSLLPALLLVPACALAVSRWQRERKLQSLVFDETNDESIQGLRLSE